MKTDKFTLFVYCNVLVLLSTVCSQNINKQIVTIADENLTDYSFLSRYRYTKSKNYLWRRYRIRHWIPCLLTFLQKNSVRFTTIPSKALPNQEWIRYPLKLLIFICGFYVKVTWCISCSRDNGETIIIKHFLKQEKRNFLTHHWSASQIKVSKGTVMNLACRCFKWKKP